MRMAEKPTPSDILSSAGTGNNNIETKVMWKAPVISKTKSLPRPMHIHPYSYSYINWNFKI